jgi:hypothetical protein
MRSLLTLDLSVPFLEAAHKLLKHPFVRPKLLPNSIRPSSSLASVFIALSALIVLVSGCGTGAKPSAKPWRIASAVGWLEDSVVREFPYDTNWVRISVGKSRGVAGPRRALVVHLLFAAVGFDTTAIVRWQQLVNRIPGYDSTRLMLNGIDTPPPTLTGHYRLIDSDEFTIGGARPRLIASCAAHSFFSLWG